jgi:hypothetical protein
MRGQWLFISHLLDAKAIGWVKKDGKTQVDAKDVPTQDAVLVVLDYDKFHQVAKDLLAELQRIKATRDEKGLAKLFEEKAPLDAVNEPWVQSIIKRGEKLAINAGFIDQPWKINDKLEFSFTDKHTIEGIVPDLVAL